jgi:hypothetical protein
VQVDVVETLNGISCPDSTNFVVTEDQVLIVYPFDREV